MDSSDSGNLSLGDAGRVLSPYDVEFDKQGRAWVADAGNDRVVELDNSLEIRTALSGEPYAFSGPGYMDLDAYNRMYGADKYADSVKVTALPVDA